MICILQIACLVYGIIVLVKGKFNVTKNRAIFGTPARLIGAIMVAWLPLALAIGIGIGFWLAMSNPGITQEQVAQQIGGLWWIELVLAGVVVLAIVLVATMAEKHPTDAVPVGDDGNSTGSYNIDSKNPYEPPTR